MVSRGQKVPADLALLLHLDEATKGVVHPLPAVAIQRDRADDRTDAFDQNVRIGGAANGGLMVHAATQSMPAAPCRKPFE